MALIARYVSWVVIIVIAIICVEMWPDWGCLFDKIREFLCVSF